MGSGQMVGGFDGWQGSTPGGSGGGGGGVTQLVAGTGIAVSPPGGTGVVTVSNTGVLSLTAGSGITVDNTNPQAPIISLTGFPYTLNSLYTAGLSISDTANTLVGSYYGLFFNDEGGFEVNQSAPSSGVDFDQHPAFSFFRNFDTFAQVGLMGEYVTKYDQFATPDTVQGGGFMIFNLQAANNAQKTAATFGWELRYPSPVTGYTPSYIPNFGIPNMTEIGWSLLNRRDGGAAYSNVLFNSDGGHYRDVLLISGVTAYRYNATELQMIGEFSGAFAPALGSELAYDVVTVGIGAGPGGLELGHASVILDSENLGSAQATGHMEWWLRGPALGDAVKRSMTLHAPNATILSSTDAFAFSYDTTLDRATLSNNGGAYSPIATLADIGPASGTLVSVDVPSASLDFKTATTPVVVPVASGRRFLPIAAYVEFTTVTALTVGPSIKLGNNGAHDNVAPVLAVANTVVTDDLVPFVMASGPVIITLTTTGIIAEFTVNATATTATGRVHVIGVYTA